MKLGRWIGFMALLVALYLLWRIRQVLLLIFTAVVLTIPFNRLVQRWCYAGMRRPIARGLAVATLLTGLFLVGSLLVPSFIAQLERLIALVLLGLARLQDGLIQLLDRLPESFQPAFPTDSLVQQAQPLITWAIDHFFALFSNALVVVFNLLLILVLTVMLLVNPGAYRQGLIRLFPSFYRQRVDAVLTEYEDKLVRWMRATLWKVVIVGVASALGLWLLQVPLVLTNAVLAGLLETIPHVGVVLSLIPPFAAAGLRSPEKAVTVVGLYLLIQLLKQVCLEKLEHRHPDAILPAVVLLAQLSLAFFCGFSGLLLAVPLLILAQVGAREILVKDLLSPGWKSGPPLKRWGRPWKSQEEHVAPQQQSTLQEEDPDRDGR